MTCNFYINREIERETVDGYICVHKISFAILDDEHLLNYFIFLILFEIKKLVFEIKLKISLGAVSGYFVVDYMDR